MASAKLDEREDESEASVGPAKAFSFRRSRAGANTSQVITIAEQCACNRTKSGYAKVLDVRHYAGPSLIIASIAGIRSLEIELLET